MDPTLIALIGTVMGGVGLKVVEHYLGKSKVRIDDATQIRNELRLEIDALRAENRQLEVEVDKWREDYYNIYRKMINVRTTAQLQGVVFDDEE